MPTRCREFPARRAESETPRPAPAPRTEPRARGCSSVAVAGVRRVADDTVPHQAGDFADPVVERARDLEAQRLVDARERDAIVARVFGPLDELDHCVRRDRPDVVDDLLLLIVLFRG